ncbi:MAG TPA: hypothetical protein VIP11_03310 [Gemmatimonadaceae bacterium]
MNASRHLTEAERHEAADGSLAPDQQADITAHLEQCETCASDVARVKTLMTRLREMPSPVDTGPDLWPEIRSRIEQDKIVQLPATDTRSGTSNAFGRRALIVAAGLAAALLFVMLLPPSRGKGRALPPAAGSPAAVELQLAADSARTYEREATILLNELELRRAMLRPQQRSSLDRDLKIIDDAIVELKDAIARDPNNPALRRLLASSYKQKVDLLKRVGRPG